VLGRFDLDPASSDFAQQHVKAENYLTIKDNSLTSDWYGRVWLNPPYAQPAITHFAEKMASEIEAKRVTDAIVLTHNYTDTAWFHRLESVAEAICFTRGRIRFEGANGEVASPTQGQAFFYYGSNADLFRSMFSEIGFIR
jgi:phage N-6-adenine-methyltransferase